jgi:hypothetical protein
MFFHLSMMPDINRSIRFLSLRSGALQTYSALLMLLLLHLAYGRIHISSTAMRVLTPLANSYVRSINLHLRCLGGYCSFYSKFYFTITLHILSVPLSILARVQHVLCVPDFSSVLPLTCLCISRLFGLFVLYFPPVPASHAVLSFRVRYF